MICADRGPSHFSPTQYKLMRLVSAYQESTSYGTEIVSYNERMAQMHTAMG